MSTKKEKEKIKKPITNDEEILEDDDKKSLILLGLGILLVVALIAGIIIYYNVNKPDKDTGGKDNDTDVEVLEPGDETVVEEPKDTYYVTPVVNVNKPTVTKYTVEYYLDDELLDKTEVESGKNINGYELTLEGLQKLKYWYYIVDGKEVIFDFESDTVTSNLKLYAKIVNRYFVEIKDPADTEEDNNLYKFVAEEKDTLDSLIKGLSAEDYSELFVRETEGIKEKLTGFYTDKSLNAESKFDENTEIEQEYVLYAKYERLYKVVFIYKELEDEAGYADYVKNCIFEDYMDGEVEVKATCKLEYVVVNESATKITDLKSEDKTIKDWYLYDEETGKALEAYDFEKEVVVSDIVLVPEYEETFTLTYDTQGGSTIDPVVLFKGDKLAEPEDPEKEGYTFVGWIYKDAEGLIISEVDFEALIDKDVTIYAVWEFSVTFDMNGGKRVGDVSSDIVLVTENEEIELPRLDEDYKREGYIIAGYSDTKEGEPKYFPGDEFHPTENTTLYVIWEAETPEEPQV